MNDYPALTDAIWERQMEIVDFPYDLWQDNGDEIFDGYFRFFFPPGFIDRNKEYAKKVMQDIYDIVHSPVVRHSPEAIHCYVMYHMIEAWYDDESTNQEDRLPDDAKAFLDRFDNTDKSDDDEDLTEKERIENWFRDKDSCLGDFEDTYDQDYMDETVAEAAAEAYLSQGCVPGSLGVDIRELVELLPNDLYGRVVAKLKQSEIKADHYVEAIWHRMEGFFHVLSHSETISSRQGAIDILLIFKDWVENNGGWKDIQAAESSFREETIHRLIYLGAKTYLTDKNLDLTLEGNIGVGREDIKISRGNDKTIIEVKLTSNPNCRHGFEKQLPRYAEAEHTDQMIFCLIDLGDQKVVDEIKGLAGANKPTLMIIDATPQKSASVK